MTKKMKGVALAPRNSSPSPYCVYNDPIGFKHQSLLQDYEELYKETEGKKNKLETMKRKRSTLLAEVRFLRRRYKDIMQNQSQSFLPERQHPGSSDVKNRNVVKKNSQRGKKAPLPPPVPTFHLKKKGKICIGRQNTLKNGALSSIPDVHEMERIESGKEATVRNVTLTFDLNQILEEEEELQGNREQLRTEEPKKSSVRGGRDEQYSDMVLSACRNIGDGPSKSGKRKISWQDQLPLKV